jgi:hypothetical protein
MWHWAVVILFVRVSLEWLSRGKTNEQLQKRVLDLDIRLHKLQEHLGFVADASGVTVVIVTSPRLSLVGLMNKN